MSKILSRKSLKLVAITIFTSLALMMSSVVAVHAQGGFISPGDNPAAVSGATGGQDSVRGLALTVVNFFLTFLGLLAVVMIIYGGFLYVSAAGKEDKIESAKKIIMYSIIGILIILLSFAIVNTILQAGTGAATT